jgi:DNA-directed RNA polymerase I, II, and III subunit RPABC1
MEEQARAVANVHAMMVRRGYAELDATTYAKAELRAHVARVERLNVNALRDCVAAAAAKGAALVVVLVASMPTAPMRLGIAESERTSKLTVEYFTFAEMQINIMEHELQPEFCVLSDAEARALLVQHRIKLTQLPRLLATDPCARYLGVRRGTVVRITRRPPGANELTTFRVVV